MIIKFEHLIIASTVWIILSSLILYRKNILPKKGGVAPVITNENSQKDIINYPKPFTISLVFTTSESPDPLVISDWVVKYQDLINSTYSLPAVTKEKNSIPSEEDSLTHESSKEITHEDIENLDVPELSKGLFESLSGNDYETDENDLKVDEPKDEKEEGDNYENISTINSEF